MEKIIVVNTRYKMRQFIFVFNNYTGKLFLFIKLSFDIEKSRWNLKDEYQNNLLLRKYVNKDDDPVFSFPNVLGLQNESNMTLLLQSPVHGLNLNDLIMKNIHKNHSFIIDLVHKISEIIAAISKQLSCIPEEQLNSIDPHYYEDYLGMIGEHFKININNTYVQHGDFASGNIFKDIKTNQWIIIDWEWMAKGYPPLFDLFCFLTSIKFTMKRKPDLSLKHYFENQFEAFIYTYFNENWLSKEVRQVILNYAKRINLSKDMILSSFLSYLCFCCNKYKLFYSYPDLQKHYENLLLYAVTHHRNFIILSE